MTEIHPSELQLLENTKRLSTLGAWLAIGALPLCAGVMLSTRSPWGKLGGAIAGAMFTTVGQLASRSARETEYRLQDWSDISAQSYQNLLYKRMNPINATVTVDAELEAEPYQVSKVMEEAVGIALLGNSGSGKSSVAKYIISLMGDDVQILVLDPHDDGDTWGDLPVISNYDGIVEQLELLLEELDDRRPRRRQKEQLDPVAIISDEWPAIRYYCSEKGLDVADRFLLRFGSESRKFNMLCLFCSQSGNTKALGMEGKGDFLENYLLIRLHKVALKYAKNLGDQTILHRLKQQGFPCLVGEEFALHPTHGHYPQFKKGLPPANLKQLQSRPLTIKTTKHLVLPAVHQPAPTVHPGSPQPSEPVHPTNEPEGEPNIVNQLNRLLKLEYTSSSKGEPVHPKTEFADPFAPIPEPWAVELVHQLRQQGWTQNQIIPRVWNASKGKGKRYGKAREKYLTIIRSSSDELGTSDT
jgi:hypothetical protein